MIGHYLLLKCFLSLKTSLVIHRSDAFHNFKKILKMKKSLLFLVIILCFSLDTSAQVGVNTVTPRAELEVAGSANGGGFLTPQYALTGASDATTVTNPQGGTLVPGTIIYNTATVTGGDDIEPGLYSWDGGVWSALEGGGGSTSTGNAWELAGNSAVGADFLGTTNFENLRLRVNNTQIAEFLTDGGIALGTGATTSANSFVIGQNASTTNIEGVAIGNGSAGNFRSVAIGFNSASNGTESLALGFGSGAAFQSVAIGRTARTLSAQSVAIGKESGVRGFRSISLGWRARVGSAISTAIGANAIANQFNSMALGTNAITTQTGQLRLGAFTQFDTNGAVVVSPSDGRFKTNVKDNVGGLDFIMSLRPVTYTFDYAKFDAFHKIEDIRANTEITETGFIAQEIEEAMRAANFDFDGLVAPIDVSSDNYKLSYSKFVVPLTKAIQEQQQLINDQNAKIKALEDKMARLESLINKL